MILTQNSIKFYQKYFDIPFCYDKLDLIPIPEMNYRTMENLGCIEFLNYSLLYTHFQSMTGKNSFFERFVMNFTYVVWRFNKERMVEWYLVKWRFCKNLEFVCLNSIEDKEYKYWDNFIVHIYESAITSNENFYTHPINTIINRANEID